MFEWIKRCLGIDRCLKKQPPPDSKRDSGSDSDSDSELGELKEYLRLNELSNSSPEVDAPPDEKSSTVPESFSMTSWRLFKQSLSMILCFDYSALLPALPVLFAHIQSKDEENAHFQAAGTLSILLYDIAVTLSAYSFLSIGFIGGPLRAAIQQNQNIAENKKELSRLFINAQVTNLPWLIGSTVFLLFSEQILKGCGQNKRVSEICGQFLRLAAISLPFTALRMGESQFYFMSGKVNTVIKVTIPSLILFGIGLSYVLSSVAGLGVEGIALGILAQMVWSWAGIHYGLRDSVFDDIHCQEFFNPFKADNRPALIKIIRKGYPFVATYGVELSILLTTNAFASRLGEDNGVDELAALNLARLMAYLGLLIGHGAGQATYFDINGAVDNANRKQRAQAGMMTSLGMSAAVALAPAIYPKILMLTFNSKVNDHVRSYANILVRLAAGNAVVYNAALNMMLTLRTTPDDLKPAFYFNFAQGLGILASYFLAFHTKLELYAVIVGPLAANGLALLIMSPQYIRNFVLSPVGQPPLKTRTEGIELNLINSQPPIHSSSSGGMWCCPRREVSPLDKYTTPFDHSISI